MLGIGLKARLRQLNTSLLPGRLFFGPQWLVLGVNNVCNLHCKMCDVGTASKETNFYQNLMGARPLNMPRELLWKIIEEASRDFPMAKLGYAFTEPSVYPHLIESITYASEKKLFTSVTTNGLKLPDQALDLAAAGLIELNVSLDGPPETHNKIRGNARSFEKAMEGLDRLFGASQPVAVSIFCTISEWNIGQLELFLELLKHLPLKQVGFMHPNYTPASIAQSHNEVYGDHYAATVSNLDEMEPDKADLDILAAEIDRIEAKSYPFPVHFSPNLENRDQLEIFYQKPEILIGSRCLDVFSNIMIKSDGSVIPAHGRCYPAEIGNLNEKSLAELWNAPGFSRFRKTISSAGGLLPACSRCCSGFSH